MDEHILQYYSEASSGGRFYRVRALHQDGLVDFAGAQALAPLLPKGWWELAQLSPEDRIEFVRGFWVSTLPYSPQVDNGVNQFFSKLDDIGIFLTQESEGEAFVPQMVFSESGNRGFFHGFPPTDIEKRAWLRSQFSHCMLPADYLAFLKIHDGFSKVTDTGLIPAQQLRLVYQEFQALLAQRDPLIHCRKPDEEIDPSNLIPFYQSFGMDSFQCFYADWYPQQEMGNVYYSGIDHSISNYTDRTNLTENLAFPTFLDWLVFYLELIIE